MSEGTTKELKKINHRMNRTDTRLGRMDRRFDGIDKRLDGIDRKLEQHDEKFDVIIRKLIEHDEKFEQVATKEDLQSLERRMLDGQDQILTILVRLDQERIFTHERLTRLEKKVGVV